MNKIQEREFMNKLDSENKLLSSKWCVPLLQSPFWRKILKRSHAFIATSAKNPFLTIHIIFGFALNRTWIAGFVGGRFFYELAGPS